MCVLGGGGRQTERKREISRRKETKELYITLYDEQVDYSADLIDDLKRS